jgi:hypothetical protein
VKVYSCRVCDANLYFENYLCMTCGTAQAYSRDERAIVPLDEDGLYTDRDGTQWHACSNAVIAGCTWLTLADDSVCFSSFRDVVVGIWIPLSIALNQINRGMGKGPLYPFLIPDAVTEELELIASIQSAVSSGIRRTEGRPASA